MNLKTTEEKNNSLTILKILLDSKISKDELLKRLEIKDSTFYRHLNLIRKIGFNISKDENTYELMYFKNSFNFAKYELSICTYLLLLAYIMLPKIKVAHFSKAIQKMLFLATKEEYETVKEKYEHYKQQMVNDYYMNKITLLKKYIEEKSKANILTKDGKKLKIKPLNFFFGKKEKIYLNYLDYQDELKSICLDNIIKISQDDKKIEIFGADETIFELYGKLTKSYLLKENERIIEAKKDKLVIANCTKDKDILFRRLLRYDVLCKVVFPKDDFKNFKNIIEKTLANID